MPEETNSNTNTASNPDKADERNLVMVGLEQQRQKLKNKLSYTEGKETHLEKDMSEAHKILGDLGQKMKDIQDRIYNDEIKIDEVRDAEKELKSQLVSVGKLMVESKSVLEK
jgi:uncharacterized protein YqgV (UPF0045/DUF77 family)